MKRILVNLGGKDGCTLHRLLIPYSKVLELSKDFDITWGIPKDTDNVAEFIIQHDIFIFHRIFPIEILKQIKGKTTIIIDMDDFWELGSFHPLYYHYLNTKMTDKIKECVKIADYVTTATTLLADKIKPFNPNVTVFPNALPQMKHDIKTHNRIRFGFVGGSTHLKDLSLLEGVVKQLPSDILNQIQFVLCGFDRGIKRVPQKDGTTTLEDMDWKDNGWVKMEKILTDNYNIVSPKHKELLQQYKIGIEYDFDEPYKRVWSKDIFTYLNCFNEIDVLLVPLQDNEFNHYKSELKMVEAGATNTPVIVSNVYPYKICAKGAIDKGGIINTEGNCLLVDNDKGSKAWCKAIIRLVKDINLKNMIANNISKLNETDYNLNRITEKRIEFLNNYGK